MASQNEIAILYSGGTDSTCTATIMAKKFEIIHLLTFDRLGFFSIENASHNVYVLREKFPTNRFIHKIIKVDRLAKYISYGRFIQDMFKYGFFMLSNCIICGLVHHFRTLIYCLDNKVFNVADGVTKDWPFFPTHMEKVILEFREMYSRFNIVYHTPVYDFDVDPPMNFMEKICFKEKTDVETENYGYFKKTTGKYLFDLNIFTSSNVKGTKLDHKMQPRCFQFILHHIFLYWYFMTRYDYTDFESITLQFLREKINNLAELVEKNPLKINKICG